ncbi:MAG TPA: 2-oxo acid dehydrogenase subunit E2 [Prolixibacteraceae bacterium]|nr:2-oxo acid dehydrogenase subunit E2 [Prolixibacteraceae bacterium]
MNSEMDFNTPWRRVAAAIYKKPVDSKIFGSVEMDVTDLEAFVSQKRKEGIKVTPTHLFTLIIARALKMEVPELNCYVKRGKIVHRDRIDALVSVLQADGGMSSVSIPDADRINVNELAKLLGSEIFRSRTGKENGSMQSKNLLSSIPWPFRKWVVRLYKTMTIDWGISVPFLGLDSNSFGSFLVTNIGTLGLDYGYPALLPVSNVSFVFVLGGTTKKPVVVNDEIIARRMMSLSIVLDHRLVDASHGGRLLRFIKYMVKNPQELDVQS